MVFAVTSGKGGVGKTNIAVNLAYHLAQRGQRVVVFDADLSLANVDIMLGIAPKYNLFHVLYDGVPLQKVLYPTQYGFSILPAASGVREMMELNNGQKLDLLSEMETISDGIDYLLVDTGAGISDTILYFNMAAQQRLVVLTPDPTSLTDAYALIKVLYIKHKINDFKIIVNIAEDYTMAQDVFMRLQSACDNFLDSILLEMVGFIPRDVNLRNAVMSQELLSAMYTDTPSCAAIGAIASKILNWNIRVNLDGNIKFFWKKLLFR